MSLSQKITDMISALNRYMSATDGKLRNKADKSEIYTTTQLDTKLSAKMDSTTADDTFAKKEDTAPNASKLGNQAPSHYATATSVSELETEVGGAFQQLADSFNAGADLISGTPQHKE
ncbi:hypothetical protein CFE14_RS15855 [Vibrio parahaemolyticus]|nr:hypothetical protein [Vibrio parahaemolyticus]